MRSAVLLLALCACTRGTPFVAGSPPGLPPDAGVADSPPSPPGGGVAGAGPTFAGCPMFPASDAWNTDVSAVPADPHSADYLAFMGAGTLFLHPNFGGPYGQPVTVVAGTQPRVPMSFLYTSQSEPGPYPFPPDVGIEAGPDRHVTVLENGDCKIFETYNTFASGAGFHADSGAVFDLVTGAPRPDGWTSATAAGLPILPGLARYDEVVEQGEVRHALAFIAGGTAHKYVAPATHSSGTSTAQFAPPMGLRVRLRADFDLSGFKGPSLVILRALQKYGMFVTDNAGGQFWSLAGALDSRWPVAELEPLKTVPASAFEVVQLGTVHTGQ
ncbi:MAG TPA: hypothetical protein VFP15_08125 [Gemmatimonadaceae bacterium]|nr:hypothetical protein [Gemmatimonadaceae bacterium]